MFLALDTGRSCIYLALGIYTLLDGRMLDRPRRNIRLYDPPFFHHPDIWTRPELLNPPIPNPQSAHVWTKKTAEGSITKEVPRHTANERSNCQLFPEGPGRQCLYSCKFSTYLNNNRFDSGCSLLFFFSRSVTKSYFLGGQNFLLEEFCFMHT